MPTHQFIALLFRLRASVFALTELRRDKYAMGYYMPPRHAARLLNSARLRSQTISQISICSVNLWDSCGSGQKSKPSERRPRRKDGVLWIVC